MELIKFNLGKVPINLIEREDTLIIFLKKIIEEQKGGYSIAINAEKILRIYESEDFHNIVINAKLWIPDGILPKIFCRLKNKKTIRIDFPILCLKTLNEINGKLGIIGTTSENIKKAATNIKLNYPKIDLIFYEDGFQNEDTIFNILNNNLNVNVVFLGMGSPKQEYLSKNLFSKYNNLFFVNVGGALDIISGSKLRAPKIIQYLGIEWLYRFILEPSRFKRQVRIFKLFKYIKNILNYA